MRYLVFAFLFSIKTIYAQKKLNLDQCIDLGFKENFEIKNKSQNILLAENTLKQSQDSKYPSLTGSFSQGVNGGRSIDPFSNTFVQRSISSNSFGLNSNFNIYNGFSLRNQIEQNTQNIKISQLELQEAKRDLKNNIILAYMQVLLNQEILKIYQDQEKNLSDKIISIKEAVKEGVTAKTVIIDFEAQLAMASFESLSAKNNIELAKLSLEQLLGFKKFEPIDLEIIKLDEKKLDKNIVEKINQLIFNQPIIKAADLKIKSAGLSISIAEAAKKPSISLNGGLGSAYSSAAATELNYFKQLNFNLNQYLRLGINIPIYSNGQISSRINAAVINQKIAKIQYDNQLQRTQFEIEKYLAATNMAFEKLESSNFNLNAQNSAYISASERFTEGILNAIELNTFRQNLEKAKSNSIQAKYEYHFRKMILNSYLE